jgi:predicted MPP superfamily phosphohydrolase
MVTWRFVGFWAVSGAFVIGIHFYLYRRLIRDTTGSTRIRRAAALAAVVIIVVFLGLRAMMRTLPLTWSVALSTGVWFWMGLATYLFLFFASVDLLRRLPRLLGRFRRADTPAVPPSPERRLFLSRALAGGGLFASGGLASYGLWRAFEPAELSEVPIRLPKLPKQLDGFTIVHLSDLHISSVIRRNFIEEVVRRCNQLKPDLVAITGDLVDGEVDQLAHAVAALRGLQSRYGTYFVTGNHDYYSGVRPWTSAISAMGIQVLRNRRLEIGDAGASFDLVGVDDWSARINGRGGYDLERAIAGRDPDRASVLLAHEPANFDQAVERGMGLQLSGHTHGGQLFPLTALVAMRWSRYAGLYRQGPGQLYVSRGVGFWGPPMRVGSPPEIVKLTLLA